MKADYILANPPFNVSDWSGNLLRDDRRWTYGAPPLGNANYAWIQHFIHHLAPPNGRGGGVAGFVMTNGSLSSNSGGEGEIRRRIVEADLVDAIVALPVQKVSLRQLLTTTIGLRTDSRTISNASTSSVTHGRQLWMFSTRSPSGRYDFGALP